MRILALALVLVTPMATPTAATESDDPEDVVLEFVDAVIPRLAGARIPCEEDLIATTRSAGVGVLCFRPSGNFESFVDDWEAALLASPDETRPGALMPWQVGTGSWTRFYTLRDVPFMLIFFEDPSILIINYPGPRLWDAGKRSVLDMVEAMAAASTTRREGAVPPPPALPSEGPLMAGVGDVTNPRRLPDSYIAPKYPEEARADGLTAIVTLQVTVSRDGTIDEIAVIGCSRPGKGFEQAAIDAVRQWRYEPATREGKPVDVYFKMELHFELQ